MIHFWKLFSNHKFLNFSMLIVCHSANFEWPSTDFYYMYSNNINFIIKSFLMQLYFSRHAIVVFTCNECTLEMRIMRFVSFAGIGFFWIASKCFLCVCAVRFNFFHQKIFFCCFNFWYRKKMRKKYHTSVDE